MGGLMIEIAPYLLGAGAAGLVIGWLSPSPHGKGRLSRLSGELRKKLHDAISQRNTLTGKIGEMETSIEAQQAVVRTHEMQATIAKTELRSAQDKAKSLERDVYALEAEREDFKSKLSMFQNALTTMKQRSAEVQEEFVKVGEFYKGELAKSFEVRKALAAKIENAKLEHESYSNLLDAERSEHESANKMLDAARSRLGNLDALEQSIIALQAENAQLNHDARQPKQEIEALQHDAAEMDELKHQNKELAHCLESMEKSRTRYEKDAQRYREQAGQSEKLSDTLRMRLDEVEKNFADMENQQRDALEDYRKEILVQKTNGQTPPPAEKDDLQEIIGIGKVFESKLNKLGVYTFQKIGAFDVADIARVNAEVKGCRGRMERDDWIGQARELHVKKYGRADDD